MRLLKDLAAAVFPQRCLVCDRLIEKDRYLCGECEKLRLNYPQRSPTCDICGLRLEKCGCRTRLLYEKAVFPLPYEGKVRASLQKLKFKGYLDKVEGFAALIQTALGERGLTEKIDVITFIPMMKDAEYRRGYNQAQVLAEALAKRTGIPCERLLEKICDTPVQHSLSADMRRGNLLGAYEPPEDKRATVAGKTILVTDDILTTGSTCNEAAKTLLIYGAEAVYCAAAAATPRKEKPEDPES
ncbi:MAG: ComF family protein [Clostridia bacterium]|nr:ComF family protein [Clostridia bacterium]